MTASQAGCSIRLEEIGVVSMQGEAIKTVSRLRPAVHEMFRAGSLATEMLAENAGLAHIERVAGHWFDLVTTSDQIEACAGYWLADMFIKKVSPAKSEALTNFLVGHTESSNLKRLPSVRRYPTGGISEKQALILPPLLHGLSKRFGWCSSFLVAAKLAHTGGTRDKLSILPGFNFVPGSCLSSWTGRPRSVVYFSADEEFCPRDAMMYRLRSETGAVADFGLMAASIMSKQISAPADIIVLDILYGPVAFIDSRQQAIEFGELCCNIGAQHGIDIRPIVRPANGLLGRSVGASTEILEAADIIRGKINSSAARDEFRASIRFLSEFASGLGHDVEAVANAAHELVTAGEAFSAMLELWAEHGVCLDFLDSFSHDSRSALLGGLSTYPVVSASSGFIHWSPVVLADIVNGQVNVTRKDSKSVSPGGIEIFCDEGDPVVKGQVVAQYYLDPAIEGTIDFSSCYVVSPEGLPDSKER